MNFSDIVALIIVGFLALVALGIAAELLILVGAGAAVWGWYVILSGGDATAIVWGMAIFGPLVTIGMIASSGDNSRAR
ncbi:hypothetical protein [Brevibacterium sp. CFH 10365]|uniref:hypothetical protein n=1 Tax=Brevibacterium sp. CFH 10365 TaxID=2585207 RepID=UPI0012662A50|nr:hypothetical protein [Brevibacterium sp. CFH 10365]